MKQYKSNEELLNHLISKGVTIKNRESALDAIEKYTSAMKLAKECSEKLKNAEENVNKILTENGTLEDFKIEE